MYETDKFHGGNTEIKDQNVTIYSYDPKDKYYSCKISDGSGNVKLVDVDKDGYYFNGERYIPIPRFKEIVEAYQSKLGGAISEEKDTRSSRYDNI